MVIGIIVVGITLLIAGFVAVWAVWPASRRWIESPKYQPVDWDRGPH